MIRAAGFNEHDVVVVIALRTQVRDVDGSLGATRQPKVGDVGTIVHLYNPNDAAAPVVVECVDDKGRTLWLADFDASELAPHGDHNP